YGDKIDAGAVSNLRELIVVQHHGDDFSTVALHVLKRGERHAIVHRSPSGSGRRERPAWSDPCAIARLRQEVSVTERRYVGVTTSSCWSWTAKCSDFRNN